MAWQEPIFDRTEADVQLAKVEQSSTPTEMKGAMDYRTLNRIEGNIEHVSALLNQYGYVNDASIKTDWNRNDFLLMSEMNRVIDSLNSCSEAFLGVKADLVNNITLTTGIDWGILNEIERILFETDSLIKGMISGINRLSFKLGTKPF